MRKINEEIVQCFAEGREKKISNTEIKVENGNVFMYLHGNIIAAKPIETNTDLTFHLPIKFQTSTTKSRLNSILDKLGFPIKIISIKTIWFFENTIDGKRYPVMPGPNFIHK